jgi:hypothetical protein
VSRRSAQYYEAKGDQPYMRGMPVPGRAMRCLMARVTQVHRQHVAGEVILDDWAGAEFSLPIASG